MKWFTVILVVLNAAWFGWAYSDGQKIRLTNEEIALEAPADIPTLTLLSEAELPLRIEQDATAGWQGEQELPAEVREFSADLTRLLADTLGEEPGAATPGTSCVSMGPIILRQQARHLHDWLNEKAQAVRERYTEDRAQEFFWIYLSPDSSTNFVSQTIQNLEEQGIENYQLISRGNLKNAISLGLFAFRWEVEARIKDLRSKGYHPLVVPYRENDRLYWVDVRLDNSALKRGLLASPPASGYSKQSVSCAAVDLARPDS